MKLTKSLWAGILLFSFLPWILIWILSGIFVPTGGLSALQMSVQNIGGFWSCISPIPTLLIILSILREYHGSIQK